MSLTYGFYNSNNGDRRYSAKQISEIFDGIITDGVFLNFGSKFEITPGSGTRQLSVGTGRAWFNHTWTYNDSPFTVTIEENTSSQPRIDTIVLEVDEGTRINSIKALTGSPAASPSPPTLVNTATKHVYPLADIYVYPNASTFYARNITSRVGTEQCPYATNAVDNWDEFVSQRISESLAEYLGDDSSALYQMIEALGPSLPFSIHFYKRGASYSCDKTAIELEAAVNNGQIIDAYYEDQSVAGYSKIYKLKYSGTYSIEAGPYLDRYFEFIYSSPKAITLYDDDTPTGSLNAETIKITYDYYVSSPNGPAAGSVRVYRDTDADDTFIVSFSGSTDQGTAACNKTFDEIWQAYIKGQKIIGRWQDSRSVEELGNFKISFSGNSGKTYEYVSSFMFYGNTYERRTNGALVGSPDYVRECYISHSNTVSCYQETYYRILNPESSFGRKIVKIDSDNNTVSQTFAAIVSAITSGDGKPVVFQLMYGDNVYVTENVTLHKSNGVFDYLVITYIIAPASYSNPFEVIRVKINSSNTKSIITYNK